MKKSSLIFEIILQAFSPFSAIFSCLQNINTITTSVGPTAASFQSSFNGASGISQSASITGSVLISLFTQTTNQVGHCSSAIAAISSGQPPPSPPDAINDPAFGDSFPDCSAMQPGGQSPIKDQIKLFVAYVQVIVNVLTQRAQDYENARKDVVCTANAPNTTNVQPVIAAWNNCSAIANSSSSASGNGQLIVQLGPSFSSSLSFAFTLTINFLNQVSTSSPIMIASCQQGNTRTCRRCTANGGADSDDGKGSKGSGESVFPCQKRENNAFKRKCALGKKKVEYERRQCHLNSKSLFSRVGSQKDTLCQHIKDIIVSFQIKIDTTFSIIIKNSLMGFSNCMLGFGVNVNASFSSVINASQQIIANAHQNISASINSSIDSVANVAANFASQIIGDAPTFPCCQDFLNQTVAAFQNASSNISSCAKQSDTVLDQISVNITSQLAVANSAFNNFTSQVDQCLVQPCSSFVFFCFNFFFSPYQITGVQQCIDSVNASANAYSANLSSQLNQSLANSQASADKYVDLIQV